MHAVRSEYRSWLVQDRIYPHPDLVALAGTNYLQTAQVISYLDARDCPQIPIAWLRIIGADSVADNFKFGTSGNLVGTIDLATGRLEHVLGPKQPGPGLRVWSHHPGTRAAFDDFRVPFMDEVRDLVSRAALAFAPLRTIGWDVAITDTGPSLIEGNVGWDHLPTVGTSGRSWRVYSSRVFVDGRVSDPLLICVVTIFEGCLRRHAK